jgi:hypothetical protein
MPLRLTDAGLVRRVRQTRRSSAVRIPDHVLPQLGPAAECPFGALTKLAVHLDEALVRPTADLLVAGLRWGVTKEQSPGLHLGRDCGGWNWKRNRSKLRPVAARSKTPAPDFLRIIREISFAGTLTGHLLTVIFASH